MRPGKVPSLSGPRLEVTAGGAKETHDYPPESLQSLTSGNAGQAESNKTHLQTRISHLSICVKEVFLQAWCWPPPSGLWAEALGLPQGLEDLWACGKRSHIAQLQSPLPTALHCATVSVTTRGPHSRGNCWMPPPGSPSSFM